MQALIATTKVLLHVAALAFVLWVVTGGFLWKGKPSHLPAARAVSSVIVAT